MAIKMDKTELIDEIHTTGGYSKKDSATMLKCVTDAISTLLAKNTSVAIPNFGRFYVHKRAGYTGKNNLANGEAIEVAPNLEVRFRPFGKLSESANEHVELLFDD